MAFKKGESGNPLGRPRNQAVSPELIAEASRLVERRDSWTNFYTGMGTNRDKRTYSWFSPDIVTDVEAENLWRGDDICRRIIEAVPKTAFRRGITLKVQDKDLAEKVQAGLEDLNLINKFVKTAQYENAYGGGAMVPVFDGDVQDLETPLDEDNLGKLVAFHLLEPRELTPVSWYSNLTDKKFREPDMWRLVPINSAGATGMMTQYIHESRLIIFKGRRISSRIQSYQRPGWGDSILSGVYPIVRDFGSAWGHAAALLEDFAQGVLSMSGYAELMKENGGESIIKARLQMLDMMKSTMRMMVVDKDDTYSRQTTPMGGLSDMLHDFMLRIAAAAEQPVTVLFGMAPAGLNATGDNDVRGWYDTVSSHREHEYKPLLDHAIRLYLKSADSPTAGKEPDVWSTEFPALWEPTEKEQAETRLAIAQTDQIYAVTIGACTADDIAESRWKGDTFSAEMTIDWDRREKQQKAEADMAAQQQELELAKANALANNPPPTGAPPGGAAPADGSPPPNQPPPEPAAPATMTVAGKRVPVKKKAIAPAKGAPQP